MNAMLAPSGANDGGEASQFFQAEWGYLVPFVHRALANPSVAVEFPRWPLGAGVAPQGYWLAAYYIVVALLGWREPWRGLWAWSRAGRPVDDPRLALLKSVWDSDGQLDLLIAWLWARRKKGPAAQAQIDFEGDAEPGERWWKELHARFGGPDAARDGLNSPYHGGNDPMHLAWHIDSDIGQGGSTELVVGSRASRRAVLLLDRPSGWRHALEEQGETLPKLRDQSWHVDVVAKPFGWLGTFRQSRETGLWFQGKHSLHLQGNSPTPQSKPPRAPKTKKPLSASQ